MVAVYKDLHLKFVTKTFCHELAAKKMHRMLTYTTCMITSELYTVDILLFIFVGRAKRGRISQHIPVMVRSKPTYPRARRQEGFRAS